MYHFSKIFKFAPILFIIAVSGSIVTSVLLANKTFDTLIKPRSRRFLVGDLLGSMFLNGIEEYGSELSPVFFD